MPTLTMRAVLLAALIAVGTPPGTPSSRAEQPPSNAAKAAGRPGFLMAFSADLVNAAAPRDVDRRDPFRETLVGTTMSGISRTRGRIRIELIPSDSTASVRVRLKGTVTGDAFGQKSCVCLHTRQATCFEAVQDLDVDPQGARIPPARVAARSSVELVDVGSNVLLPLRPAVIAGARCQFRMLREQAEEEVSALTVRRARQQMRDQILEGLGQADQTFNREWCESLLQVGIERSSLRFATSESALTIRALSRGADVDAAPAAPRGDLTFQLHEAFAEECLETSLAGKTMTREEFEAGLDRFQQMFDERQASPADEAAWSITFTPMKPVRVAFANGEARITLRGESFVSNDKPAPAMDVTARYRLSLSPDGVRAERVGEPEVYPPGFVPGGGVRLTPRQQTFRTVLRRRFHRLLPRTVDFNRLPLSLPASVDLKNSRATASDGWFALAADRAEGNDPLKGSPAVAGQTP